MLQVKNLMVFFENALALNDFSMEVQTGEFVGVIGPNSAGKTTLMNALSGLIVDMRVKEQRKGGERIEVYGDILFEGKNITHLKPSERVKKGIVLSRERHPVFPESSVLENLKIAGYLRTKAQTDLQAKTKLSERTFIQGMLGNETLHPRSGPQGILSH